MKIGILSRNSKLYSTRRLAEAARKAGHEARVVDYVKCHMNITRLFHNYGAAQHRGGAGWSGQVASTV